MGKRRKPQAWGQAVMLPYPMALMAAPEKRQGIAPGSSRSDTSSQNSRASVYIERSSVLRHWVIAWTSVIVGVTVAPQMAQANASIAETVQFSPLVPQSSALQSSSAQAGNDVSSPSASLAAEPLSPRPAKLSHTFSATQSLTALDSEPMLLWSTSSDSSVNLSAQRPTFVADGQTVERSPVFRELRTDLDTDLVAQLPPGSETLPPPVDPELGTLRLRGPADPELGVLRLREPVADDELGNLLLQEQPLPPENPTRNTGERSPSVYLLGGVNIFRSDNVFSSQVDPVGDSLFLPGLSIYARPRLGPETYLIASVGGYLVRYVDFPDVDYNELRFRLGLRQILSNRMYGEVSWTNTQLFDRIEGDRFLDDHALRLLLYRSDPIAPNLSIDSFYQFRLSLANPEDRSRISNSLGVALVYEITPELNAALNYQLTWTNFTEQARDDLYNELIAELRYDLSPTTQINLYGGFSFGESSRSDIDFNSGILGIGINFSVPLF